jgi:hypothetical protein
MSWPTGKVLDEQRLHQINLRAGGRAVSALERAVERKDVNGGKGQGGECRCAGAAGGHGTHRIDPDELAVHEKPEDAGENVAIFAFLVTRMGGRPCERGWGGVPMGEGGRATRPRCVLWVDGDVRGRSGCVRHACNAVPGTGTHSGQASRGCAERLLFDAVECRGSSPEGAPSRGDHTLLVRSSRCCRIRRFPLARDHLCLRGGPQVEGPFHRLGFCRVPA